MAKNYVFFVRASKANASVAFNQAHSVRVTKLQVNPVTHDETKIKTVVIRPVKSSTLHREVAKKLGVIHAQRELLIYEVGA